MLQFVVTVCCVLAAPAERPVGEIRGVVVNGSQGRQPCAGTEVVLRVKLGDQFLLVGETTSDAQGAFRFDGLPLGRENVYLAGANRDGVHYPGERLQLTGAQPQATVTVQVCDAIREPSPLVIKRQEVLIQPDPRALRVTESLVVSNPTSTTYVGPAVPEGSEPVTLRLSIPRQFDRTTFHKEFYGRRFVIADNQLVTGIPWTPGDRELKFVYTLPNDQGYHVWERPLDLPCEQLRVRIVSDQPDEVTCNLDPAQSGVRSEKIFSSKGQALPAGYVLRVQLGRLPIPWLSIARWSALGLLAVLVAGTGLVLRRRQRADQTANKPSHAVPPEARLRRTARAA